MHHSTIKRWYNDQYVGRTTLLQAAIFVMMFLFRIQLQRTIMDQPLVRSTIYYQKKVILVLMTADIY